MTIRLLPRHALPVVPTLAFFFALVLSAGPVVAQQAQGTVQLQRADGSTAGVAGAPWTPSGATNLSQRGGEEVSITHSASLDIVPVTGVSCPTAPNSHFRVFDLSEFIDGALDVTSVDIGVEEISAQTTTVNLYTLNGPLSLANLSLVSTQSLPLSSANNLSLVNVPITGSFVASDVLVLEWAVPQSAVFFGGNGLGQTGPTYLAAPACGATEPTDLATLGFPNSHWVAVVNGVTSEGPLTIADARAMGPGAEVTVQGTVTRAKGAFTYFQDATGGLTIRQTEGAFFDDVADGTITTGTRIRVTGTLSEFRGLLQINAGDFADYEILGQGASVTPQAVTLQELIANGEAYEAELVRVTNLTTDAVGTFTAATSYNVTDPTATLESGLRIPNAADTDVDGTEVPEGQFTFTGVIGQFTFDVPADNGYQLLAIEATDIGAGPIPVDEAIHDTGDVQFEVFNNGYLGTTPPGFGETGFVFNGDNGLFHSSFVVGASEAQVSGNYYGGATGTSEWVPESGPLSIPLDFEEPFEDFDQSFESTFQDGAAPNPIGLEVTQRSYSNSDAPYDQFVIVEYTIENTSGADLTGIYPGIFADWDVGGTAFETNLGGYDAGTRLLYNYDQTGTSTNYFGVAALGNVQVSGVSFDALGGAEDDFDIWSRLTTIAPEPELGADRRSTLGVGPYDIAAGESVVVRFAFVGGESLSDIISNAAAAQAVVAEPVDQAIHDTGRVQFEVFDDGNLGTVSPGFAGTGFVFDGAQGLFAATVVVGQSQDQVSGTAYDSGDWVTTAPLTFAAPPSGSDQAFAAAYDDSGSPNPIGVEVNQRSYSSSQNGSDGYVIVELDIENISGADLEDIYVGIFADWDVGTATVNLGDYHAPTRLLYVYDDGPAPNYYGLAALQDNVSGYNLDAGGGFNPTDEDVYNSLTTFFPVSPLPDDRRTVLGVGPYDIAAGESVVARFAFVGGVDLAEIIAHAAAAQGTPVAAEESTPDGTFVLHAAYPNPFAASTTIGFSLPTAQDVRLSVYDVLGRRVATLVDGPLTAGEQSVRFDASGLASGTYIYRLEAGSTQLTQRVTIVR